MLHAFTAAASEPPAASPPEARRAGRDAAAGVADAPQEAPAQSRRPVSRNRRPCDAPLQCGGAPDAACMARRLHYGVEHLCALLCALLAAAASLAASLMMQPHVRAACDRRAFLSGVHGRAYALALAAASLLAARPVGGQTSQTCSVSSWMYVGGFTGASAGLNGYYAPYYITAAPLTTALQTCTNAGYGLSGTGSSWASAFDTAWQVGTGSTRPVGYFNTRSTVSNASNFFWVRDYATPALANTQSYWNLVLGTGNCPAVDSNYYIAMNGPSTANDVSGECAHTPSAPCFAAPADRLTAPSARSSGFADEQPERRGDERVPV